MSSPRSDRPPGPAATPRPPDRISGSLADAISARSCASLERLIPPAVCQQLARLTRHLPAAMTQLWGYELPIDKPEVSSDFLLCLHQADVCNQVMQTDAGLRQVITEPLYGRLRDVMARWADPDDRMGQVISNFWLEYDYEGLQPGHVSPNLFFGPKSNCHWLAVVGAARQLFEPLSPEGMPAGTYRFLVRCIGLLGSQGRVTQIGQMLARHENRLRLFIQQLPTQGILPYLRRVGYPHAANPPLAAQLNRCYQLADAVDLDVDITDRIGSQLGLECYFNTTEKAVQFLDDLVKRGLCVPQKHRFLREHMLKMRPAADDPLVPFFSHVKLGFHPDKGFSSKVYLGYVERSLASSVIQTQPIQSP